MLEIRPTEPHDTSEMASILNALIADGSTTALSVPVSVTDMQNRIDHGGPKAIWHVAITETDELVGFQWVEPHKRLHPEVGDIATFARMGRTGLGVGSALFDATKHKSQSLGYEWINASIRADNPSGLRFYASRGFYDYSDIKDFRLDDGRIVDKVLKRFDLGID
ncbi:MAG: GNAT family N-acetyltransferase [Pseudomonadota bacterium]